MEITINISVEELSKLMSQHSVPMKRNREDISVDARWFDENATGWTKNQEINHVFLCQQERYANEKLRAQGYLFLNDVYDMLGFKRTARGQVLGWIYNKHNPVGDNYVDFGLNEPRNRGFVNGYKKSILLDFNVDGDILWYL